MPFLQRLLVPRRQPLSSTLVSHSLASMLSFSLEVFLERGLTAKPAWTVHRGAGVVAVSP